MTQTNPTSPRKAQSNRRNAAHSTGPRTARGKSWSRLNALKHGILASQTVIATTEGKAERTAFDQLVDGLGADFVPVGTFEQVLVQQIASCIWRQRRVLRFENRAAFQARDNRTFAEMNRPQRGAAPTYLLGKDKLDGADILDEAEMGLDLPSERDTMRLIRYEASITRSLKTALAQLKAQQKARRDSGVETASIAPAYEDRAVTIDRKAIKRDRGPEARRLPGKVAMVSHAFELKRMAEEAEEMRAEEEADAAAAGAPSSEIAENYQTKPNMAEDPEALLRHQQLLEAADAVLRLSDSLAPKRPPSVE